MSQPIPVDDRPVRTPSVPEPSRATRLRRPLCAAVAVLLGATTLTVSAGAAHAAPTFTTTSDVGRRTAPTAAPDGGYGMAAGTAFSVICQVEGQPHGRYGNRLYFKTRAPREHIDIFIPDAWTNSPHQANQPPLPGIPMCDTGPKVPIIERVPSGPGAFPNAAIADHLLARVGQNWGRTNGQCRQAVNLAVAAVSGGRTQVGGFVHDYNEGFRRAGAYRVPGWRQAIRGDVVQVRSTEVPGLHTYVIVANHGNGTFRVVDSNARLDTTIRTYDRSFDHNGLASASTIWRIGRA